MATLSISFVVKDLGSGQTIAQATEEVSSLDSLESVLHKSIPGWEETVKSYLAGESYPDVPASIVIKPVPTAEAYSHE